MSESCSWLQVVGRACLCEFANATRVPPRQARRSRTSVTSWPTFSSTSTSRWTTRSRSSTRTRAATSCTRSTPATSTRWASASLLSRSSQRTPVHPPDSAVSVADLKKAEYGNTDSSALLRIREVVRWWRRVADQYALRRDAPCAAAVPEGGEVAPPGGPVHTTMWRSVCCSCSWRRRSWSRWRTTTTRRPSRRRSRRRSSSRRTRCAVLTRCPRTSDTRWSEAPSGECR